MASDNLGREMGSSGEQAATETAINQSDPRWEGTKERTVPVPQSKTPIVQRPDEF